VSLVVEEYRVPGWLYWFTQRFAFEERSMPMV